MLLDHVDLDARLARADLVITAEGSLDGQTVRGKVPAEVARRAKAHGVPVLALAGTLGQGVHEVRAVGVDAYGSILPAPVALPEALDRGAEFLADAAERALRMVLLGTRAGGLSGRCQPRSGTQRAVLRAGTSTGRRRGRVPSRRRRTARRARPGCRRRS
ncbi:hypothetical protein Shyd_59950 [Streptomyces hydrogenans]|uniref:Glycerate kinase n=1 Tax=Streptomyces hydrogenans TaxID=1873719 RepID=A0ABQ3PHX5_9ACTN|nr:hypothetical protein Shyd_59950 [Streptomyces hydrogenans]